MTDLLLKTLIDLLVKKLTDLLVKRITDLLLKRLTDLLDKRLTYLLVKRLTDLMLKRFTDLLVKILTDLFIKKLTDSLIAWLVPILINVIAQCPMISNSSLLFMLTSINYLRGLRSSWWRTGIFGSNMKGTFVAKTYCVYFIFHSFREFQFRFQG